MLIKLLIFKNKINKHTKEQLWKNLSEDFLRKLGAASGMSIKLSNNNSSIQRICDVEKKHKYLSL